MGNKQPAYWEVRRYRRGDCSILSKSKTVDMGRAALWAAVDCYHQDMIEGDYFLLSHGARIILTVRLAGRELELRLAGRA